MQILIVTKESETNTRSKIARLKCCFVRHSENIPINGLILFQTAIKHTELNMEEAFEY